MDVLAFREYCLALPGTSESTPFDETTLVFKVMGKMFALADMDEFDFVNLKCDPDQALELRERFEAVQPGYHMSKKHWNSVYVHSDMSDEQILHWTRHSYDLVASKLPKKLKDELAALREAQDGE